MAAEEKITTETEGELVGGIRHFLCCTLCGASHFDGTFCTTCLSNSTKVFIAMDAVHAPTEREDASYTICGMWIAPSNHPIHRPLKTTMKSKEVTCGECEKRIRELAAAGGKPRRRPV